MVKLANVSFKNSGNDTEIFYKVAGKFAGKHFKLKPNGISPKISGVLLTIDVIVLGNRYSYDFTNYLPNGLWVEKESPYILTPYFDSGTTNLMILDSNREIVGEFKPAND